MTTDTVCKAEYDAMVRQRDTLRDAVEAAATALATAQESAQAISSEIAAGPGFAQNLVEALDCQLARDLAELRAALQRARGI